MNQAVIVFLHRTFDGLKALSQIVSRAYCTPCSHTNSRCPPRHPCKKESIPGKVRSKSCRVCAFLELPNTKRRIKCNEVKVVDPDDPCACEVPVPHPKPPGCHPFKPNVPLWIRKDCKPGHRRNCSNKCFKGSKMYFIIDQKCIK